MSYEDYVDNARDLKKKNETLYILGLKTQEEYNLTKKMTNGILDAYGLMVAGSVMLSIFGLITVIVIYLIIKENRKLKMRVRAKTLKEK